MIVSELQPGQCARLTAPIIRGVIILGVEHGTEYAPVDDDLAARPVFGVVMHAPPEVVQQYGYKPGTAWRNPSTPCELVNFQFDGLIP
jgi:hypothetical protein